MRADQSELDQDAVAVGADGDDLIGLVWKRSARGGKIAAYRRIAVKTCPAPYISRRGWAKVAMTASRSPSHSSRM